MSTTTTTYDTDTHDDATDHGQQGADAFPVPVRSSHSRTIVLAIVAALAGAAVTAGLVIGSGATTAPPAPAAATPTVAVPAVKGFGALPAHHVAPRPPAAVPSAATETLQRELGTLNYYEGPITGTMTPQTVQAITYLQRDAHLPQTGTMTPQTQAALVGFLANGNNQMGS